MKKINSLDKLKEKINDDSRKVIMFSTEWCGECKMNFLLLEEIIPLYPDTSFYKVDADELMLWEEDNDDIFKIKSVPTYHLYENKKLLNTLEGFANKDLIDKFLN